MRVKKGKVVSTKMDKTIVVEVESYKTHPKYFKKYRVTKKFHAACDDTNVKEGDTVTIQESIPLSKTKRWVYIKE